MLHYFILSLSLSLVLTCEDRARPVEQRVREASKATGMQSQ